MLIGLSIKLEGVSPLEENLDCQLSAGLGHNALSTILLEDVAAINLVAARRAFFRSRVEGGGAL
jgi:hypothetical protein